MLKRTLNQITNSNAVSSLLAIAVGLLAGLLVLLVSNAGQAIDGFIAILTTGLSSGASFGRVLYFAAPIIMTGLSVGFASRTGLFNIGAAGQFMVGAYVAILIGVKCTFLPGHLLWITATLGAALAGMLWGAVPGLLKAFRNVNEVISSIMMNYIGMYLVNWLIRLTAYNKMHNQSMTVADNANIPKMGLDVLLSAPRTAGGIVIALIAAVIIYIILEKTVFGYELKACGFNHDAARYAGISEKKCIVASMAIAGALAGLGGAMLYLSGAGKSYTVVEVLAAEGFNGIPVALLGLNNPIGIIFSGLFIAHLTLGGEQMQLYSFAMEVIQIIIAIIIYFSAFALLLKSFIQRRRTAL
jgi:simple sugar transport system permease protein